METPSTESDVQAKHERLVFAFIAVVLFPILSIVLVGGYGLLVWVLQMIFGPPTA